MEWVVSFPIELDILIIIHIDVAPWAGIPPPTILGFIKMRTKQYSLLPFILIFFWACSSFVCWITRHNKNIEALFHPTNDKYTKKNRRTNYTSAGYIIITIRLASLNEIQPWKNLI